MKKPALLLLTAAAIILTGMSACNKSAGADTPYARLIGTWKLKQLATDDNSNNHIDASEIHNTNAQDDNEITFNKDSTGKTTDNLASSSLPFQWHMITNDSIFVVQVGHDTFTYFIQDLSSGNLTLVRQFASPQILTASYYVRK